MITKKSQPFTNTITGTFKCPVCGGSTSVHDEINPVPLCHYCGAPLPELKEKIDERFNFIQEQYRSSENREKLQLEFKQQQEMLKRKSAEERRAIKIENQQRTREAKIQHRTEVERMRNEQMERARQHQEEMAKQNRETQKQNFKHGLILIVIGVIFYFIIFGRYIFK